MKYSGKISNFVFFGSTFIIVFYAFIKLSLAVVSSGLITILDSYLVNLFYFYREEWLAVFFSLVTFLGSSSVVIVVAIALIYFFFVKRKFAYILSFVITFFGAEFSVYVLKEVVGRLRPPVDMAFLVENSFSFPSGHATIAVALYGFIIYILFRESGGRSRRMAILFIGVLLIFLIGLSRLYLGVHFLSDVVGGFLLGLLWLIIGIVVSKIIMLQLK